MSKVNITQAGIYSVMAKESKRAADTLQEVYDMVVTEGRALSPEDDVTREFFRLIEERRYEARNYYNRAKKIRDEYSK